MISDDIFDYLKILLIVAVVYRWCFLYLNEKYIKCLLYVICKGYFVKLERPKYLFVWMKMRYK